MTSEEMYQKILEWFDTTRSDLKSLGVAINMYRTLLLREKEGTTID